ncbi:MAG TPA: magnesium transporter MgtC [Candidatus Magasanikbacteria bacterium]|nr:MAG: hypothetical protein A3I74_02580 [Candidatus Magasanikbacteria bacterium RIFCSPLOWO2_02_FULL_47_16]OGH79610.1 MAG: hypothetical protein A3C10_00820 [Candidatus Magasanikbacteria bacterium RIFCSPHIGHO2_02_FULL_48_18]OGH82026.1 MAG: hypothetical protein A3G08_02330 [Candidatus Magasanikbacteria bacterium RIFCSPLOWO2_12_FULL_47_9b]HAZ28249.1 magnesium transporter MgtC [Candidatus Magasanikbacteria bacterium]
MPIDIFVIGLLLSMLLGALIGWQREWTGKAAGSRTYALVCVGSYLFTILSIYGFQTNDTARIAAQIITGIGFLGAGTIIHKKNSVEGLTTAAGLWAIAAIGMTVGVGWYPHAAVGTILLFAIVWFNDKKIMANHHCDEPKKSMQKKKYQP